MEKEFVPYELALRMKQLGFDGECFKVKLKDKPQLDYTPSDYDDFPEQKEVEVGIPLFQQAFRWFREKHGIMHRLTSYAFGYQIHLDNTPVLFSTNVKYVDRRYDSTIDYKTYEEAELSCLEKLIEIVEQSKTE